MDNICSENAHSPPIWPLNTASDRCWVARWVCFWDFQVGPYPEKKSLRTTVLWELHSNVQTVTVCSRSNSIQSHTTMTAFVLHSHRKWRLWSFFSLCWPLQQCRMRKLRMSQVTIFIRCHFMWWIYGFFFCRSSNSMFSLITDLMYQYLINWCE